MRALQEAMQASQRLDENTAPTAAYSDAVLERKSACVCRGVSFWHWERGGTDHHKLTGMTGTAVSQLGPLSLSLLAAKGAWAYSLPTNRTQLRLT